MIHRVFGGPPSDALHSHILFLERANREAHRGGITSAELAFGAYIVSRLIDALLERDDSPDSQAGFQWQRDVTIKRVRELHPEAPEATHLANIVGTIPSEGEPPPALAVSLTAYAYFLEYEGRLDEALDILSLSARTHRTEFTPAELASYALFAGKLNRLLTRWEPALMCYRAAEEAGHAAGDLGLALRGRLHQGTVARGQGNLPKAQVIAEEVIAEAIAHGLSHVQSLAYADLSAIYSLQGAPFDGIRASYAAFLVATTPVDRMSALGDLAIGLAEVGAADQARLALQIVADAKTDFRLQTNALIELMALESIAGDRLAFERHRARADTCRERMPPSMLVDFQFKVGLGLARFGILDRARAALVLALELAEAHALNAWYFRIEQALTHLSTPEAAAPSGRTLPLPSVPVIHEVELGLREFSAATSA